LWEKKKTLSLSREEPDINLEKVYGVTTFELG
jgi:hypothetical protein